MFPDSKNMELREFFPIQHLTNRSLMLSAQKNQQNILAMFTNLLLL